jgi:hypothetical protein
LPGWIVGLKTRMITACSLLGALAHSLWPAADPDNSGPRSPLWLCW